MWRWSSILAPPMRGDVVVGRLLTGDQPDHALIRQAAALVRRLPVMDAQQFDSSFLTVSCGWLDLPTVQ